jgi:hypothetical protein
MPDTNESALEKTFSDLAYSHLRDRSQALLDYLVGFQMLKQEDDGQRAVGIFGFEIDEDYYYAPIFFLNGEIRGLDSLYSVKSDLFVPITDDWVNSIINRRQVNLGEKDSRTRAARGVHVPNYTRLKIIPGGTGSTSLKLAADQAEQLFSAPRSIPVMDLPAALASAGLTPMFKKALAEQPRLHQAFSKFYGLLDLYEAPPQVKRAQEEPVIIINTVTDEGTDELTDEQRTTILEGGTVVIDRRPEVSKSQLYSTETREALENPTVGCLYDLLLSDGTVTLALILRVSSLDNSVLVYNTEDKKHCIIDSRKVWCLRRYSNDELKDWLDNNAVQASSVRPGQSGSFVSCAGECTGAFNLSEVTEGVDDITVAKVDSQYFMDCGCPIAYSGDKRGNNGDAKPNMYKDLRIGGNGDHEIPNFSNRPGDPNDRVTQVIIAPTGGTCPRYSCGQVVVNDKYFYFLKLNTFKLEGENGYQHVDMDKPRYDVEMKGNDFGSYNTVRETLEKVATDLKVWADGDDVNIKVGEAVFSGRARDAFRHCVMDLGLGEQDAGIVVKTAGYKPEIFKYRPSPKTAAELLAFPEIQDTDLGGFLNSFQRQQVPFENLNVAQPPNNREFYTYESPFGGGFDGEDTFGVVEDAAQTGQKDVFDAAALGSLIKNHNPTDLVDRFLPTITAGMDRIGRMLFLIYWHYADFEDRYGENDLSEFIDNLRAVFEQLGDVIIFAKKRTLAGDPEHYGIGAQPIMEEAS